jgi:benzoyl-CoA reductase/2-hydroxyglutaryl-CoA dehydratase subunit BcrC/BadD/HgdB
MYVPRPFLTFLEIYGAHVVAEDSEADERTLTQPVSSPPDSLLPTMLEILATAYLAKPPGPRPSALSCRLGTITRLLDERNAQGVIAVYPKFADAYLAEYVTLGELFDSRDLPALLLEDDGESGFTGQQRTRVEALLEVIA